MRSDEYSGGHRIIGGCDTHYCGVRLTMVGSKKSYGTGANDPPPGLLGAHAIYSKAVRWLETPKLPTIVSVAISGWYTEGKGLTTRRLRRV